MRYITYLPHGLNHEIFKPIESANEDLIKFKKSILGDRNPKFTLLYNSRNIRRKQIPDTLLAFKYFLDKLKDAEKKDCVLLLHTQQIDEHGTDLLAIIELFELEDNVVFTNRVLSTYEMSLMYNISDGTILLTNNEGWGLALTETLLTGKMFIANVTGGMQDQMRFTVDGEWFTPTKELPSNHKGDIKEHGEWVLPVYPTSNSIQGSVPTPYIFDDRCQPSDAAECIYTLYKMGSTERIRRGNLGREFAINEGGFTSQIMGERFISALDTVINDFKPRERYEVLKDSDFKKRRLNHKI